MSDSQEPRFESADPEGSAAGSGDLDASLLADSTARFDPPDVDAAEDTTAPDTIRAEGHASEAASETSNAEAAPAEGESASDSRPRRRIQASGRPVSAFGAGAAPRGDSAQASGPKPLPLDPTYPPFAAALRASGLLAELRSEHLPNLPDLGDEPTPEQRTDFLTAYYAAGNDPVVSLRRRTADRWFIYDIRQNLIATELVQHLTFALPELSGTILERVGGRHGTLLLRAGEHICALDDDHRLPSGATEVTVSELVRGMNVLLERRGARVRLVGLLGDGDRECYVGVASLTLALPLSHADLLTARDAETLMNLTSW